MVTTHGEMLVACKDSLVSYKIPIMPIFGFTKPHFWIRMQTVLMQNSDLDNIDSNA